MASELTPSATAQLRRIKQAVSAVTIAGALLGGTGCTTTPGRGDVGEARQLIDACDAPVNAYVAIDGTASGDITTLEGPRLRAIENELAQVAACGGRAKVVAFSSSSAATTTLFEGGIELTGATNQARARRLGPGVDDVAAQISTSFDNAVPSLEGGGSDPVAQLRLFSEWTVQAGDGDFQFLALTDGFQTVGIKVDQIVADPEAAASSFDVPNLSGSDPDPRVGV